VLACPETHASVRCDATHPASQHCMPPLKVSSHHKSAPAQVAEAFGSELRPAVHAPCSSKPVQPCRSSDVGCLWAKQEALHSPRDIQCWSMQQRPCSSLLGCRWDVRRWRIVAARSPRLPTCAASPHSGPWLVLPRLAAPAMVYKTDPIRSHLSSVSAAAALQGLHIRGNTPDLSTIHAILRRSPEQPLQGRRRFRHSRRGLQRGEWTAVDDARHRKRQHHGHAAHDAGARAPCWACCRVVEVVGAR
jgi:hypothetical protein